MSDDNKPKQPLSTIMGAVGGIVLGLLGAQVIAPQLFPQRPGQFNVSQMLCAGACGAGGALLGFLIGRLIEGPPKDK